MGTESLDYTAILNDLEAKKKAIEAAIASLRSALSVGALGLNLGDANFAMQDAVGFSMGTGEVPDGAFLGKSIPEAARLYLEIVKKKQTTREIADALRKGGMETKSPGAFSRIVHATLNRVRKVANSPIVKVGSQWGLSNWYPKGIASLSSDKHGKKKAKRKTGHTRSEKSEGSTSHAGRSKKGNTGNTSERISHILQSKPSGEFTAQQVAEQADLNVQVAYMLLARLAKQGKVHKTSSGAYQANVAQTHAVM